MNSHLIFSPIHMSKSWDILKAVTKEITFSMTLMINTKQGIRQREVCLLKVFTTVMEQNQQTTSWRGLPYRWWGPPDIPVLYMTLCWLNQAWIIDESLKWDPESCQKSLILLSIWEKPSGRRAGHSEVLSWTWVSEKQKQPSQILNSLPCSSLLELAFLLYSLSCSPIFLYILTITDHIMEFWKIICFILKSILNCAFSVSHALYPLRF